MLVPIQKENKTEPLDLDPTARGLGFAHRAAGLPEKDRTTALRLGFKLDGISGGRLDSGTARRGVAQLSECDAGPGVRSRFRKRWHDANGGGASVGELGNARCCDSCDGKV